MRARVLTALALIPPVLAAVFCTDPLPILGLCLILAWLSSGELNRLIKGKYVLVGTLIWLAWSFTSVLLLAPTKLDYRLLVVSGFFAFAVGIGATCLGAKRQASNPLIDLLAGGWVAGPLCSLIGLHMMGAGPTPPWFRLEVPLLIAIVPLWAGDSAAIFAGKAFGKHKLAPSISPKKTVEGAIANLFACMLAAWGLGSWIGILLPQALACGFAAGLLGQAGDLFESWVKRRADLKDSGTLLPGHGGILDRIDSILFTAPVVALILIFWK